MFTPVCIPVRQSSDLGRAGWSQSINMSDFVPAQHLARDGDRINLAVLQRIDIHVEKVSQHYLPQPALLSVRSCRVPTPHCACRSSSQPATQLCTDTTPRPGSGYAAKRHWSCHFRPQNLD